MSDARKVRLDQLLTARGLAASRERARALILAGKDACRSEAGGGDGAEGLLGRLDLMAEEGGLDEGVVLNGVGNVVRGRRGWQGRGRKRGRI